MQFSIGPRSQVSEEESRVKFYNELEQDYFLITMTLKYISINISYLLSENNYL